MTEHPPLATSVTVGAERLTVDLADGRQVSVPLCWFPRLQAASDEARAARELLGCGVGIPWPQADEDISVEGLLSRRPAAS